MIINKMRAFGVLSRLTIAVLFCVILVTSCSNDCSFTEDGVLPQESYPFNFKGQIVSDVMTTASWTEDDRVAVQAVSKDNTANPVNWTGVDTKEYTADVNGNLSSVAPFYWQTNNEIKVVRAWFPFSATKPATYTVKADQSQSVNFKLSDHMEATDTEISFNSTDKKLTFTHLMSKVNVILVSDLYSDTDLNAMPVTFLNQTGVGNGSTEVSANTRRSVILIPQDMTNKRFIQIKVGNNNYYYTPVSQNDGNLKPGYEYTYNITIKKYYLEVTLQQAGLWTGTTEYITSE